MSHATSDHSLVTRDDDFERVADMDVTVLNRNRDEDGS